MVAIRITGAKVLKIQYLQLDTLLIDSSTAIYFVRFDGSADVASWQ